MSDKREGIDIRRFGVRAIPGRKCWQCGQFAPGALMSCLQAPPGPLFTAMMTYQEFPFFCSICLADSAKLAAS